MNSTTIRSYYWGYLKAIYERTTFTKTPNSSRRAMYEYSIESNSGSNESIEAILLQNLYSRIFDRFYF